MTILNVIYVIAAVLVLFGAAIFVHELPFLGRAEAGHEGRGIRRRLRPENPQLEARWR